MYDICTIVVHAARSKNAQKMYTVLLCIFTQFYIERERERDNVHRSTTLFESTTSTVPPGSCPPEVLKLGRGHESDVRIADVSISRHGAPWGHRGGTAGHPLMELGRSRSGAAKLQCVVSS